MLLDVNFMYTNTIVYVELRFVNSTQNFHKKIEI
jgi:hypothetical protein